MATESVRPDRVIAASENFLKLASDLGETSAAERVKASLEKLRLGIFRLVVVGEVKRGKTSFINALLSEPGLLPTDDDVATSTVYKLIYGAAKNYRVFFLPRDPDRPDEAPAPRDVAPEDVTAYGTEGGNPGNEKQVDFIAAEVPSPLLKQGLAIIDTPGLGALFAKHAAITWRYVPNADAVFFILDSVEAVASQPEMNALARLNEFNPLLVFIQTKIDLVDEEQWQTWGERNVEIIAKTLNVQPNELTYFPVSSSLKQRADRRTSQKDLERSGFVPVIDHLNTKLIGALRERLARALLNEIAREAGDIRRRLADIQRIFSEESAEALKQFESEYAETKTRFEEWRPKAREMVNEMRNRIVDARMHAQHRLQNELDPAPLGPIVGPLIEGLRAEGDSSKELVAKAETTNGKLIDFCCRMIAEIQQEYNNAITAATQETKDRVGQSMELIIPSTTLPALDTSSDHLNVRLSRFEAARNAFYGGTFGGTIASIAASLVFPPLGVAAATATVLLGAAGLLGMAVGGFFGRREHEMRKREEVLSKLSAMLSNTVRRAQQSARQELERSASACERTAIEAFETAAADMERELRGKMDSIAEASKRSRGDNVQKATAIRKNIAQIDGVLKLIDGILPEQEAQTKQAVPA